MGPTDAPASLDSQGKTVNSPFLPVIPILASTKDVVRITKMEHTLVSVFLVTMETTVSSLSIQSSCVKLEIVPGTVAAPLGETHSHAPVMKDSLDQTVQ